MTAVATTIKDVARCAGVSVATVSRALNGGENVEPSTRQRVLDVVRELRYLPSGAARSLITRKTDTIGVLLPHLYGEYFSELVRGIDQAARAHGLHLLLSSSHGSSSEAASALRSMAGRVDGVIVMWPHAVQELLARNLRLRMPVVLLNVGKPQSGAHHSFSVDNFDGAREMTRHLIKTGRRRVALLGGPVDSFEASERERGYLEGLPKTMKPWVIPGDFSEASGSIAADAILKRPSRERPDAVFAANDAMAIGLLCSLVNRGVQVPNQIAVAGFDDIPAAKYVCPALTTMSVPVASLGTQAVNKLADALNQDSPSSRPLSTRVPSQLVVRRSCGAA